MVFIYYIEFLLIFYIYFMQDSPDLIEARKIADRLQSIHHEVLFTVDDAEKVVRDVIYHLETYGI